MHTLYRVIQKTDTNIQINIPFKLIKINGF